jgi:hypothetical protein
VSRAVSSDVRSVALRGRPRVASARAASNATRLPRTWARRAPSSTPDGRGPSSSGFTLAEVPTPSSTA